MTDWLLAIIALAGLGTFLGIILAFVPEPSLIAVVGLSFLMAAYDVARELIWKK